MFSNAKVDVKKLALSLAFAFVITGIVVYQVRATRSKGGGSASAGASSAASAIAPAEAAQSSLPPVSTSEARGEATRPAVEYPALTIPVNGWGRSPFLTVDEIARLQEPSAPRSVETPVAPPSSPPVSPLPQHVFSGTSISRNEAVAFIDRRAVRVGDRVGKEIVKEIKEDSVILESDGKTRELSMKTNPGKDKSRQKGE